MVYPRLIEPFIVFCIVNEPLHDGSLIRWGGLSVHLSGVRWTRVIHWFTPEEMLQLPDLLVSNREFLRLIESGEIVLDV